MYVPAGFRDTRVVSVGRDGAALAFDVAAVEYMQTPVSRRTGNGSWSRSAAQ